MRSAGPLTSHTDVVRVRTRTGRGSLAPYQLPIGGHEYEPREVRT